jgi:FkbM family methyltransferase
MKQLKNGWHVPDDEKRMTDHVAGDVSIESPGYESRHRDTILSFIPKRETFIDVGANIGVWSIAMIPHFKKIISFEPSPLNRMCLEANTQGRTDIRPFAVGNKNGKVNFKDSKKNCGDSQITLEETKGSYSVDIVRLDDQQIDNCSLIKIDVQGFEFPVILGAEKIIKKCQPWIIFEINEDVDEICKFLEFQNYEMIMHKSKRVMIWAPTSGPMCPSNKEAFGRRYGIGPYKDRFLKNHDVQ